MIGRFLFLLQAVFMALCLLPLSLHMPGSLTLLFAGLTLILGAWVLWHNPLGNWSVLPQPIKGAQLIMKGPYAWVRHPMYSCVLLACFVFVLHNLHINGVLSWLALCLVLNIKARYEERLLKKTMDDYERYMARVSARFVPNFFA